MDYLDKIKSQIKWLVNQILCMNFTAGNADSPDGSNGSLMVTEKVKWISAYDAHLEFIDSPEAISGIKGHTVLKIKDELLASLGNIVDTTFKFDINALQLDLGWKNGGRYETKTINENTVGIKSKTYTRNAFIANEFVVPITHLEILEVNNLIVKIPDFSKIAAYNPRLLIYRYKPSKKKGITDLYPLKPVRSTAGFKLLPNYSNRPSVIPLNAGYQLLDIGQEDYFSISGYDGLNYNTIALIKPKGIGKRNSNKYLKGAISYYNAWVYLEFGIKITKDGIDYTVKPLNKIKMILSVKVNQTTNTLVSSKIKFKFT